MDIVGFVIGLCFVALLVALFLPSFKGTMMLGSLSLIIMFALTIWIHMSGHDAVWGVWMAPFVSVSWPMLVVGVILVAIFVIGLFSGRDRHRQNKG